MQTIRCVLIDDELPALGYLQMLCNRLPGVEIVKSYNNPLKFLAEMDTLDYHACVLDINMPGIDGLQLAAKLQDKAVIFSTAYKAYAVEAFDLDAVDYLRKPYQLERLEKAFLKAREWLAAKRIVKTDHSIELNTNKGKTRIDGNGIAWITVAENDRRDKVLVYKDGREVLTKNITFDQLRERLPGDGFCRINRRTMIAIDTVSSYTQQWVHCTLPGSGTSVQFPLSTQYRSAFKAKVSG